MKLPRPIFTGALLVTVATAALVTHSTAVKGDFDLAGLNNQVQNHEARIKGLEDKTDQTQTQVNQNTADVQVLQQTTNTPPAAPVPQVVTPVAAPVVEPPPPPAITITTATPRKITAADGSWTEFCDYTYSDDTTASIWVGRGDPNISIGGQVCHAAGTAK